jgi:hypothetical protein
VIQATFELTVPKNRYAGRGGNVRPGFTFSNIPDGTVSFAIIFHDVDVALNGTDDVLHWLAWNIPAKAGGLSRREISRKARFPERPESAAEAISDLAPLQSPGTITTSSNSTRSVRRWTFPPTPHAAQLLDAMKDIVLGKAAYVGRFRQ